MFELALDHDFSIGSLGICGICESAVDLLDRNEVALFSVDGLSHNPIRASCKSLNDLVLLEDVLVHLVRHV